MEMEAEGVREAVCGSVYLAVMESGVEIDS